MASTIPSDILSDSFRKVILKSAKLFEMPRVLLKIMCNIKGFLIFSGSIEKEDCREMN